MLHSPGLSGAPRRFRPSVLAAGLLILSPAGVSAHPSLTPDEAAANGLLRVAAPMEMAQADDSGPDHGHHDGAAPPSGHGELGPLSVTGAFARASVTPTGAAYLTIENAGDAPDRLLAVTSPGAARVVLHAASEEDGVMRMQPLPDGVAVPAQGRVVMAPGGMHVMLMGLAAPLAEGGALALTLRFEQAGELMLSVPIRGPGADAASPHGNH